MISFREESTKQRLPHVTSCARYRAIHIRCLTQPKRPADFSGAVMPSVAIHTILRPLPLLRGLFRWSLAVLFAVGAWHLYLWSPLPGLVAIGITPVLAIFFSSVARNLVSRTLPYWKTRRLIRKLGMRPTWWNTGAGYLLSRRDRRTLMDNGQQQRYRRDLILSTSNATSRAAATRRCIALTSTPRTRQNQRRVMASAVPKRSAKLRKFSNRPMPHRKKETFPSHSRTYGKKKTKPPKRIENESFPMKTRSSL